MKIIGISGFENSTSFKKNCWPGLDEREYRISQGHDSAAALIVNGTIVAAVAEERFNRKKHCGDFPANAIRYCLAEAGLSFVEVDELVHGFDYTPFKKLYSLNVTPKDPYQEVYSQEALLALVNRDFPTYPFERVHNVQHHLAHAASAYFTSGWEECLTVVIDGMGEAYSVTIYHAHGGKLDMVYQIPTVDSIGILYSLVTLHLGFDFNADEYKIMGLAPYGNAERFRSFFNNVVEQRDQGTIRIPILRLNRTREDREFLRVTRSYLAQHLIEERHPDAEITEIHKDVAASLQECLDRVMLHICGYWGKKLGLRKLALAGGVALNCTANGKLLRSELFDEIYIQPAAGDDGTALGAALYRSALAGEVINRRQSVPFLGPTYSTEAINMACTEYREQIEVVRFPTLEETCAKAAYLIASGKVVAWYRGRMEYGPRALGHRSILADPSHPNMRERINSMVKMREAFRPFAPAVSLAHVHQWFDVPPGTELPYMIMIVNVKAEHRATLPAVTHVDGSARVQTVSAKDNPEFHALLQAVGKATGREMVLNTSFNIKGQPIVNTPQEAIQTFLHTGIEYLFLENSLVKRKGDR